MTQTPAYGPSPRRTQAERRATTEDRVVATAIGLIAERGAWGISLGAIGEAAGYSRGIVGHHFGSREALLAAVIQATQGFDLPDDAVPPGQRLASLVSIYLGGVRHRGDRTRAFLVLWSESATDPQLARLFADRDATLVAWVAACLREGGADGSFRPLDEPELHAVVVLGLLRGVAMQLMTTSSDIEVEAVTAAAHDLVTTGLRVP